MQTKKPLREMIPEIITHVKTTQQFQTIYEMKLLNIFEGQLQKYVEESIRSEFSPSSANAAIQRIAPINVLPKAIKKLSGVYTEPTTRTIPEKNIIDTENLSLYEEQANIDSKLGVANKFLNLFKYCALEPYVDTEKREPRLRVLPPTQFTVYSDNEIDKLSPTVFIKFMGKAESILPRTDANGVKVKSATEEIQFINLFYLYSDTEFLIIDSEGCIRNDLMLAQKNPEGVNSYGVIPFVYLSLSEINLIPLPNSDTLQMVILIPKLLTDLNYATKFQSFSQLYGIDVDVSNLSKNPDVFWDIKSNEGMEKSGSIGSITPSVDVDKVLSLLNFTIDTWFDTLGLVSKTNSTLTVGNAASGISKAIDNADTTAVVKEHKTFFKGVEKQLWALLPRLHERWVIEGKIDMKNFSKDFAPVIEHGSQEILPDPKIDIEVLVVKFEKKLTSYKRAVMKANPELNETEILELIEEIKQEGIDNVKSPDLTKKDQDMFEKVTKDEDDE